LRAVKVIDGYRRYKETRNMPEAEAVARLIAELVKDPAYDGMDFGVVTLLSGDQARVIAEKLFERVGPEVITSRRIRVGEPANFQGDERDVILISTVVATDPANPDGRIGAATSTGSRKYVRRGLKELS
jgi:superfamily I DNA and/or RNA helicase